MQKKLNEKEKIEHKNLNKEIDKLQKEINYDRGKNKDGDKLKTLNPNSLNITKQKHLNLLIEKRNKILGLIN